jgi:hypothetical protein
MASRTEWPEENDSLQSRMASREQDGQQRAGWPAESRMASREQDGQQRAGWPAESRMASREQYGQQSRITRNKTCSNTAKAVHLVGQPRIHGIWYICTQYSLYTKHYICECIALKIRITVT